MMVITGGIGTLVGPIVGAMVFILVQEILSSYTEHWMIFTGAIFVLMVIFLPGGLVGTANAVGGEAVRRLSRRFNGSETTRA
jgi:branched-chain amino acid transport system permease protein